MLFIYYILDSNKTAVLFTEKVRVMKLSQETLAKRSATKKAQREERARNFISEHGEYLQDARVMSYGDLMTKYKISYDFCKALEDIYCIKKDEKAVEFRRAEKFTKSMRESGIEQRKKTVQERYGVKTPLQLSRVRELSDEARLEAIRLAAEERLNDFIESAPDFAIDFQQMTIAQLADKYHITESYCAKVLKYLGLSKTKEELDAHQHDVHLALRDQEGYYEKRQEIALRGAQTRRNSSLDKRIDEFMGAQGEEFLADFPSYSLADIKEKYGITEYLYEAIRRKYGLQKDAKARAARTTAKIRETCQERYGVDYPINTAEAREKGNIASHTQEVIEKTRRTMLERHGVESMLCIPEVREKGKKVAHSDAAKERARQTLLSHFGVPYSLPAIGPSHTSEAQQKREQTRLERYGTLNAWNHEKIQKTLLEKYGVACSYFVGDQSRPRISKLNKAFAEELRSCGVESVFEEVVLGRSFDIGIGHRLLIEINPTVSHSYSLSYGDLTGLCPDSKPIERSYHFKKWKLARKNGFELLSLFDWTSKKKFLDFVLSKCGVNQKTVGARKFELLEVPKQRFKEVNAFLDENHVLGACRGTKLCYALVDDDAKLYSVMTFGKPRYRKDCDFELLRFASLVGFSIPGAASKLFKRFADEHKGARIITYSDNNLGNGSVYKSLGFEEVGQTGPADVWCSLNGTAYVKDVSLIMQGADRLLGGLVEGYFPVGLDRADFIRRGGFEEYAQEYARHKDEKDTWWPSNQDIMRHYGFVQVADCGATIWVCDSEKSLSKHNID